MTKSHAKMKEITNKVNSSKLTKNDSSSSIQSVFLGNHFPYDYKQNPIKMFIVHLGSAMTEK